MTISSKKSRETFEKAPFIQTRTSTTKPKKYSKIKQHIPAYSLIEEENAIYVSQLQELAKVFSFSDDRHIRQYIINLAKGVIERANDYAKVEAYISEMTN